MEEKNKQNNLSSITPDLDQINRTEPLGEVFPKNIEPISKAFTLKKKVLCALAVIWVAPLVSFISAIIINLFTNYEYSVWEYVVSAFWLLIPFGLPGAAVHAVSIGIVALILRSWPFSRDFMNKPDKKFNMDNLLFVYLIAQIPLIVTMIAGFIFLVFIFPFSGFQF